MEVLEVANRVLSQTLTGRTVSFGEHHRELSTSSLNSGVEEVDLDPSDVAVLVLLVVRVLILGKNFAVENMVT